MVNYNDYRNPRAASSSLSLFTLSALVLTIIRKRITKLFIAFHDFISIHPRAPSTSHEILLENGRKRRSYFGFLFIRRREARLGVTVILSRTNRNCRDSSSLAASGWIHVVSDFRAEFRRNASFYLTKKQRQRAIEFCVQSRMRLEAPPPSTRNVVRTEFYGSVRQQAAATSEFSVCAG